MTDTASPGNAGADDWTPSRTEGVDVSDLRDGVVVYDPRTHTAHHLNPVATLVWELVGGRDVAGIAAQVARVLEVDAATARDYTRSTLEQLRTQGVVS